MKDALSVCHAVATLHYPIKASLKMVLRRVRQIVSASGILLAVSMVACTHVNPKYAQNAFPPGGGGVETKSIVGVTLTDGRRIRFDEHSAPILHGDTLQASAGGQPLAFPVSELQQVWVKSLDMSKTALAVFGIPLGLFAAYMIIGPVLYGGGI